MLVGRTPSPCGGDTSSTPMRPIDFDWDSPFFRWLSSLRLCTNSDAYHLRIGHLTHPNSLASSITVQNQALGPKYIHAQQKSFAKHTPCIQ